MFSLLVIYLLKESMPFVLQFPTGWIFLIASLWCSLHVPFLVCISSKLIVVSRSLIRFGLNFGEGDRSTSIKRHIMTGCLSCCDVSCHWCSIPRAFISLDLQNDDILIPLFSLHLEYCYKGKLTLNYCLIAQWYSFYWKGRINAWFSLFIITQNNELAY